MAKPARKWIGALVMVCAVATCNIAVAQKVSEGQHEQSGVEQSLENAEVAAELLWPFRPCESNDDCPGNRYCWTWGDCDDPGICVRSPNACPDVWDPVCGCDGVTYSNKCDAAAAGVNVDFEGECDEVCGGIQGIQCSDPNDFCRFDEGQCCCDFQGVCTPIPDACPEFYDPVCGCDGVTYSNECFANAAGQSVDHQGACAMACTSNSDCLAVSPDPGKYCHKAVGDCDGVGECADIPQGCYDVWAPVCGCDGVTYGNDCEAAAAGVSIAHVGACEEICGGIQGIQCSDPDQFCKLGVGECCCDFQGVCTEIPNVCPLFYDPVCGCDGVTYGNECLADAASVSVDHVGACEEPCCDPADEPGVGGNPFCFEGASCCADGTWACNNANGTPSCDLGTVCEVDCCDPADEPGVGGNPFCFEGASCCADGTWACNNANGTPSCDLGSVCEVVGKCCLEGGACIETSEEKCFEQCGAFAGAGTACGGIADCPIPPIVVAACCLPDGSCEVTTECICGRRGGTWGNTVDCSAAACGEPEVCGGFAGIPCSDPDDFCKLNEGECCCDFQGVCTPTPDVCPLVFDPVCGCDGTTYSNECFADAAGVSTDHQGACDDGCQTNADCAFVGQILGEYCQKATGDCDGTGSCSPTPQYCLDVYIPVCGCDGQTYSNTCYANRVGVNVASEGACGIDQ